MLYNTRRYKAAYDCSSKAIELIRSERDQERESIDNQMQTIKKRVGLDSEFSLSDSVDHARSMGSSLGAPSLLKVEVFKQQSMKLNQQTSNHFLNYQIEKLHLEIKGLLDKESQYVEKLRVKAEELGGGELSGTGFYARPNRVKMCPQLKKCKKGDKCEFAHRADQLDFVTKGRVAKNLTMVAERIEEKITNDILPEDWKHWKHHVDTGVIERDPALPEDLTKNEELYKLPFQSLN